MVNPNCPRCGRPTELLARGATGRPARFGCIDCDHTFEAQVPTR